MAMWRILLLQIQRQLRRHIHIIDWFIYALVISSIGLLNGFLISIYKYRYDKHDAISIFAINRTRYLMTTASKDDPIGELRLESWLNAANDRRLSFPSGSKWCDYSVEREVSRIDIDKDEIVLNEDSVDVDFRVESNDDDNCFLSVENQIKKIFSVLNYKVIELNFRVSYHPSCSMDEGEQIDKQIERDEENCSKEEKNVSQQPSSADKTR